MNTFFYRNYIFQYDYIFWSKKYSRGDLFKFIYSVISVHVLRWYESADQRAATRHTSHEDARVVAAGQSYILLITQDIIIPLLSKHSGNFFLRKIIWFFFQLGRVQHTWCHRRTNSCSPVLSHQSNNMASWFDTGKYRGTFHWCSAWDKWTDKQI